MAVPVIADEEDLDQMWKEAQAEFQKISGKDPKSFAVLRVDEVISKINQKREADEKASARYRRAKDVVNKTLLCIQNLGSLAADAASKVRLSAHSCEVLYKLYSELTIGCRRLGHRRFASMQFRILLPRHRTIPRYSTA